MEHQDKTTKREIRVTTVKRYVCMTLPDTPIALRIRRQSEQPGRYSIVNLGPE